MFNLTVCMAYAGDFTCVGLLAEIFYFWSFELQLCWKLNQSLLNMFQINTELTFPTTCLLIHLFLHDSGQSRQLSFLEILWALIKINLRGFNAFEPGGHLNLRQWALTVWLYNQQAQSFLLVYKYIRLDQFDLVKFLFFSRPVEVSLS